MQREPIVISDELQPSPLTLRDVVAVLFRQWRLLLASFVVILIAAAVVSGVLTPTYKAEMKILVRRGRVDPVVTSQPERDAQVVREEITESELNSEVELLNSQDLLRKVVLANSLQSAESSWHFFGKSSEEVRIARAVRQLGMRLRADTTTQDQRDFRNLRVSRSRTGCTRAQLSGQPVCGETSSGAPARRRVQVF